MTRALFLFDDGTALVDGIEADALGTNADLPFLTDNARVAAARSALAADDWDAAEAASARSVVSPPDGGTVHVTFVAPPNWARFGTGLWQDGTEKSHAVFHSATMLVDGVAVTGCVGLPFEDDAARRGCAAWCLRNGLDDLWLCVSRTPVGGEGPFCTWPDTDIDVAKVDRARPRQAETQTAEPELTEVDGGLLDRLVEASVSADVVAKDLFGVVVCPLDL